MVVWPTMPLHTLIEQILRNNSPTYIPYNTLQHHSKHSPKCRLPSNARLENGNMQHFGALLVNHYKEYFLSMFSHDSMKSVIPCFSTTFLPRLPCLSILVATRQSIILPSTAEISKPLWQQHAKNKTCGTLSFARAECR